MLSLCLHVKELQPIYAYKGYDYTKKSTKNKEKNSDSSFPNLPPFFANFKKSYLTLKKDWRRGSINHDHNSYRCKELIKKYLIILWITFIFQIRQIAVLSFHFIFRIRQFTDLSFHFFIQIFSILHHHSVWHRHLLNRHQQPNYDYTNNTLTVMLKMHI